MRYIPDVRTVREFCTDFDTTCWANCSCSLTLDDAPNTNTTAWRWLRPLAHGEAFEKGVAGHSDDASPGFLRVRMAVDQHQSLVCMQGHCHATERQRTGLQTIGSQLFPRPAIPASTSSDHVFQPRLPTTPSRHAFQPRLLATSFSHAFRSRLPTCHSDRGRYASRQNWLYH